MWYDSALRNKDLHYLAGRNDREEFTSFCAGTTTAESGSAFARFFGCTGRAMLRGELRRTRVCPGAVGCEVRRG